VHKGVSEIMIKGDLERFFEEIVTVVHDVVLIPVKNTLEIHNETGYKRLCQ